MTYFDPTLAKLSCIARPQRELTGNKKKASRAGKTRINFASLGNEAPGGPQNWCSRARETLTFSKRCAPVYVKQLLGKQDCPTRLPRDIEPDPNHGKPKSFGRSGKVTSWAAKLKSKLGDQKKVASRAGETFICFAPLGNGGPGGLQKQCSRARETPTFSKRCSPVYVKRLFLE